MLAFLPVTFPLKTVVPKLPDLLSIAVLVISLGILQCNFHAALVIFINLLLHSWFSFLSLALSPSMEQPCSYSFSHSFHPELVHPTPSVSVSIVSPSLFYSLVSFTSCQSIFANVLPILSVSFLKEGFPHYPSVLPSTAKYFFSSLIQWLSVSLRVMCVTQRWIPLILFWGVPEQACSDYRHVCALLVPVWGEEDQALLFCTSDCWGHRDRVKLGYTIWISATAIVSNRACY